ncbi:MAG TPA: metal ABC transporter ATP-binding protein, partial [Clostridiaceae bacterium]|nr:metal ABC transporter ATP-binding protein [Clostridiaceae bacterium]
MARMTASKGENQMPDPPFKDPLVEVNDLTFGYADQIVLDHINFNIRAGDFVGIIGGNGTGKSTLLKLLIGLLEPDSGSIYFAGAPRRERRVRIGYVSQKVGTFHGGFPATVEEIVLAGTFPDVGLFRRPRAKQWAQVDAALAEVNMQAYRKRSIHELSGGQQQRVFIARAIASQARLLVLDEPTSGVDPIIEGELYNLLSRLNQRLQLTIILVSHDINVVTTRANRLFCLGYEEFFEHDLTQPRDGQF